MRRSTMALWIGLVVMGVAAVPARAEAPMRVAEALVCRRAATCVVQAAGRVWVGGPEGVAAFPVGGGAPRLYAEAEGLAVRNARVQAEIAGELLGESGVVRTPIKGGSTRDQLVGPPLVTRSILSPARRSTCRARPNLLTNAVDREPTVLLEANASDHTRALHGPVRTRGSRSCLLHCLTLPSRPLPRGLHRGRPTRGRCAPL